MAEALLASWAIGVAISVKLTARSYDDRREAVCMILCSLIWPLLIPLVIWQYGKQSNG
jgi:hypothetical protein